MTNPAAGFLREIDTWPGPAAAAAVGPGGTVVRHGDTQHVFALASVTKLATAMAVLVAHEEGSVDLDETEPFTGATVADVLAHAGGVAFDRREIVQRPRQKRIYSSTGYDLLAELVAERTGMRFADYLHLAVAEPLGMATFALNGSAGADAVGSVDDLIRLTDAWREPILVHDSTLTRARTTHLPDLEGVLPGFGRHDPNPWALGPEKRGTKSPHWTGQTNSPETVGHFGRDGTMLWIDPEVDASLIALCTEPFGPWAATAWPALSDRVVDWARTAEAT